MFKRLFIIALCTLSVTTVVTDSIKTPTTEALASYNRGIKCGYFDNRCNDPCINRATCDDVVPGGIPAWVNSVDTLTSWLYSLRDSGNWQLVSASSFIVNTMLGRNGPGSGRPVSNGDIDELSKRLKSSRVGINWDNDNFSYRYNSAWGTTYGDDFFYDEGRTKVTNDVIGVYYDGRLVYALRRECANPLGDNGWPTSVPETPWNISGWSFVRNETTNPGGNFETGTSAYPGERVTWRNDIRNLTAGRTNYFEFGPRRQYNGDGVTAPRANTGAVYDPGGWSGFLYDDTVIPNTTGRVCEWIEYQPWSSWDGGANRSTPACVNIVPAVSTCPATAQLTPSPQPGVPFTAEGVSLNYGEARAANSARNSGSNYFIRIRNGAGTVIFNRTAVPTNVVGNSVVLEDTAITPLTTAGRYTVEWGNANDSTKPACTDQFDAAYYPYFNVVGGDVSAGAGFKNGLECADPIGDAGVKGWIRGNGSYYGAGSQLAALALGRIVDFATAVDGQGNPSAPTTANNSMGNNLTFANASVSGQLGDNALPCMPDYYTGVEARAEDKPGNLLILNPLFFALNNGNTFKYSGNLNLSSVLGSIPAGRQITIIVDGDVSISTNIDYAAYSDPLQIPRFTLIAKGNIYVGRFVTELHGVYIAQGGGVTNKGIFNTCSDAFSPITANPYNDCNRKLTIYGAVAAERIKLQRTYGSLNASSGAPAEPAESFVYSPELWLSNEPVTGIGGSAQPYDAITTLPPTL